MVVKILRNEIKTITTSCLARLACKPVQGSTMLMKEVKTSPATVAPPATVSGAMQQVKKAKTRRGKGGLKRKTTPEERAARKRHKRNKKNKEKKKKAKAEAKARRAAGVEPLASSTGSLTKNPVTSGTPAPMITDTVSRVVPPNLYRNLKPLSLIFLLDNE